MKKTIYLIGMVLLLLMIAGCEKKSQHVLTTSQHLKRFLYCRFGHYEIEYVDTFYPDNCFAFRNTSITSQEKYLINASFSYAGIIPHMYFYERNTICEEIETLGKLYCLKDNSTCMRLEEHDKICVFMRLT